jgi:peptide/nickel transport system permease protein
MKVQKRENRRSEDTGWRITWKRFRRHRAALMGAVCLSVICVLCIFISQVKMKDPYQIDVYRRFSFPGTQGFIFGTDELGRDIFSRVFYAGRISLVVGIFTALISVFIGSIFGTISGYYGGRTDSIMMRFADVILTFPPTFLLLILAAFVGTSLLSIILIISLTRWMPVARIVRSEVLSLKRRDFVVADIAVGCSDAHIIFKTLLVNAMAPILIAITLAVAEAILIESTLSYLGYGIQPPIATWGNMLNQAQSYFSKAPWLAFFPGALITITVVSVNFIGDGLRDSIDPRLRNT